MSNQERGGAATSVGELLRGGLPWNSEEWTEEQWATHDAAEESRRDAEARAERERRRSSLLNELVHNGFPQRAVDGAKIADEKAPAVVRVGVWNWSAENILVLSGPAGCGKTVAAAWWALNRARFSVKFLRASAFAAGSRYDATQRALWQRASSLVLDDLGTEYADAKGSFLVDLDELIDTFYGDKRPLLITTNSTHEQFKARYGMRIVDRLRECASWFSMAAESRREKASK